jgi:RsiW-degrading membrane proteinase PrsW (M82 family)
LISWQQHTWGLAPAHDLASGLRYFLLGVGLREELCKLIGLLPIVPLLVRRRSELEALLVAASVGLGFATAENSHYFAASQGVDSLSRFLTANFFHMAATGLVGLALCRALWSPRALGPESLAVFAVVVAAHGLYDALIALPALATYSMGSTIIYVLLCYQFFRELRAARADRPETVSLTATFLFGVSCLTAATFVYLSAVAGWTVAARLLAPEILSMSLMVYVFLREMPETLVTV